MGEGSSKARQIDLGDDFGDVVVKANGATIKVDANSHVIVSTRGGVELQEAANDGLFVPPAAGAAHRLLAAKGKTAPEIGDEMPDGTILAGYYEGKPLYARPHDESGTYSFNEAAKQAKDVGGGFHVPSKGALNVLWENRNKGKLKGTFNETGSNPAGWYWSSTPYLNTAWAQRFSDGNQDNYGRNLGSSLRLVR